MSSERGTAAQDERQQTGGRRRFLAAAIAGSALAASGCQTVTLPDIGIGVKTSVPPGEVRRRSFTTRDGTRLSYLEAGRGRPVVMIPGWSQTAAMFNEQILALSAQYRVIAVDGSVRHIECHASVLRQRDGTVESVLLVSRDLFSAARAAARLSGSHNCEALSWRNCSA